jgi:hypothetical protein
LGLSLADFRLPARAARDVFVLTASVTGVGGQELIAGEQLAGSLTLDVKFINGVWQVQDGSMNVSNVPEPGTLGLLAIGTMGIALMLNRKPKTLPTA